MLNQITGDICNFVPAAPALSNRLLRSVYNYARRPILRTGLRPVQLFLVIIAIALPVVGKNFWPQEICNI